MRAGYSGAGCCHLSARLSITSGSNNNSPSFRRSIAAGHQIADEGAEFLLHGSELAHEFTCGIWMFFVGHKSLSTNRMPKNDHSLKIKK